MTQLTYDSGFQVNKYGSGDILPSPSLTEEGGEGVIMASHRLVAGHLAVWLDAVLQTVELPAGVPHLNTSLAYVDGDALTLKERKKRGWDLEKHRGWHWLLFWGLWILQALHAGTWVNYLHTATWWKQKHTWGKEGWSSKYKQKTRCSCHQISCDRLMCKAHELKRRSSSINNWAFNFALQKMTQFKKIRQMNSITITTHGIVLATTLKASDEKVANIGLFLEKMGDYGIKTFPQCFSRRPWAGLGSLALLTTVISSTSYSSK